MWRPAHSARSRRAEALGRQLVGECESFLAGRYPSVLQDHGLPVPGWAWLSVLAHAPTESLAEHATGGLRRRSLDATTAQWQQAVALLAQELVTTAYHTGCRVEELQHSLIFDIELEPSRSVFFACRAGPNQLVAEVRQALGRYRGTSHLG